MSHILSDCSILLVKKITIAYDPFLILKRMSSLFALASRPLRPSKTSARSGSRKSTITVPVCPA